MKISKSVDGDGRIILNLEDLPEYPYSAHGKGLDNGKSFNMLIRSFYQRDDQARFWLSLDTITIGDFSIEANFFKARDLSINSSCQRLAETFIDLHSTVMNEYKAFCENNTETIEITTPEIIINRLATKENIFYQSKDGKMIKFEV